MVTLWVPFFGQNADDTHGAMLVSSISIEAEITVSCSLLIRSSIGYRTCVLAPDLVNGNKRPRQAERRA
jgi:hypothetical protein